VLARTALECGEHRAIGSRERSKQAGTPRAEAGRSAVGDNRSIPAESDDSVNLSTGRPNPRQNARVVRQSRARLGLRSLIDRFSYPHLLTATLALVAATILLGVAAKATGSGLACEANWPRCDAGPYNLLPGSMPSFYEWFHRFVSMFAGFAIVGSALAAWRLPDVDRRVTGLVVAGMVLTPVQVALGRETVQQYTMDILSLHFWTAVTIFTLFLIATVLVWAPRLTGTHVTGALALGIVALPARRPQPGRRHRNLELLADDATDPVRRGSHAARCGRRRRVGRSPAVHRTGRYPATRGPCRSWSSFSSSVGRRRTRPSKFRTSSPPSRFSRRSSPESCLRDGDRLERDVRHTLTVKWGFRCESELAEDDDDPYSCENGDDAQSEQSVVGDRVRGRRHRGSIDAAKPARADGFPIGVSASREEMGSDRDETDEEREAHDPDVDECGGGVDEGGGRRESPAPDE